MLASECGTPFRGKHLAGISFGSATTYLSNILGRADRFARLKDGVDSAPSNPGYERCWTVNGA
jgi:hypothetical protein